MSVRRGDKILAGVSESDVHLSDVIALISKIKAADVGAVALDGSGYMSGPLRIKQEYASLWLYSLDGTRQAVAEIARDTGRFSLYARKDDLNSNVLRISDETSNIKNALELTRMVNGTSATYRLYGEHNKPTAADCGALAASGQVVSIIPVFIGGRYENEGGEISFGMPEQGSFFTSDITMDIQGDSVRFFATHEGVTKVFRLNFNTMPAGDYNVLHSGNSRPVVVSPEGTPPTDATAVWIVT